MMDGVPDKKVKARARVQAWREDRLENGICPKHDKPFYRLNLCNACLLQSTDNSVQMIVSGGDVAPPQVGAKLGSCFRCDSCFKLYHEGSYYFGDNPRKRRWEKERPHGIQEGPEDSLINYDKFRPVHGGYAILSLCGQCRREGRDTWKYRRAISKWPGLCGPHSHMRRGDVPHPSGAVVHRSERVLEPGWRKRPMKVKFTCANREPKPHKSAVYLSLTEHKDGEPRLEWEGLCADCRSQRPVYNKILDDVTRGGVKIFFSEENEQHEVPILYLTCRHVKNVPRERASVLNTDPPKHGVCQQCRNNPAAFAARAADSNGDGQQNGGGVRVQLLLEAVEAVARAWEQVKHGLGSLEHRLKKIDLLVIGGELGVLLDPYDDVKSRNRVTRKLTKLGVYELFPNTLGGCPAFIKAVVNEIERGASPNGVVRSLWNRHPARKIPA